MCPIDRDARRACGNERLASRMTGIKNKCGIRLRAQRTCAKSAPRVHTEIPYKEIHQVFIYCKHNETVCDPSLSPQRHSGFCSSSSRTSGGACRASRSVVAQDRHCGWVPCAGILSSVTIVLGQYGNCASHETLKARHKRNVRHRPKRRGQHHRRREKRRDRGRDGSTWTSGATMMMSSLNLPCKSIENAHITLS